MAFFRKYRACNRHKRPVGLCNCPKSNHCRKKNGKTAKLFGFFVSEAMKKTQGRGNPKIIQKLL